MMELNKFCLSQFNEALIDLNKWQELVDLITDIFDADSSTIVKFNDQTFSVFVTSCNENNFLSLNDEWSYESQSFCRAIVDNKQQLYIPNALESEQWKNSPPVVKGPVRSYCGVPIFWPGNDLVFGTICAIDTAPTNYKSSLTKLLTQLSRLITADLQMAYDMEIHRQMSITNSMTGLLNRRGLEVLAEQKLQEAKRKQCSIGIFYIDIDNLKIVNDTFSHAAGDECILSLVKALKLSLKESDLIARIGGDEFVAFSLLDHDRKKEFFALSNNIQENYKTIIKDNDELSLTSLSIGQLIQPHSATICLEDLLSQADELMYEEKTKKRNS